MHYAITTRCALTMHLPPSMQLPSTYHAPARLPLPLRLTRRAYPTPTAHQVGRASHWETRVMRDDVMSYGKGVEAVSELTLVAMEGLTVALASGCHPYPYPYP